MLCRSCRRQVGRGDAFCRACGSAVSGRGGAFELVLPGGARVPLSDDLTIGRSPASTIRLDDRSVSRTHARVTLAGGTARLEDAGSSHGTLLDGRPLSGPSPLRDGAVIGLGDVELRVERHREESEAGRTVVVPANAGVVLSPAGDARVSQAGTQAGFRPRMRPGWKLKRLAEGKVYKQIAHELSLSTSTVRTHLHNIYGKLGAVDRAQAVLLATERGWL